MNSDKLDIWAEIANASILRFDYLSDEYFKNRSDFRQKFGYAIPSKFAIKRIIDFANGPIVEICAGRGLWAHLIQLEGGTVRPTDLHVSFNQMNDANPYEGLKNGNTWTTVFPAAALQAVQNAVEQTLMVIWPPYSEDIAHKALQAFRGSKLVYVGEGYGGCTADDGFHEELNSYWNNIEEISIPQWYGIHDSLYLYERKT